MNDSKWLKLQLAILERIPIFHSVYEVQLLTDEVRYSSFFDLPSSSIEGNWGMIYEDWEAALPEFFNIEWMAIQPRYGTRKGFLCELEITDFSTVLVSIFHQCHIPYEMAGEHVFMICGYK